jgi:CheY-like chemotaxis protein
MSVLERLKRNASTEAIPVVVLSARDPAANRPKALAAGAAAFLQKPPDNARLLDVLRSVMADR